MKEGEAAEHGEYPDVSGRQRGYWSKAANRKELYEWTGRTLCRHEYQSPGKVDKGLVRQFCRQGHGSERRAYRERGRCLKRPVPLRFPSGSGESPNRGGKPGYIRVDSVHQGDLDGKAGIYHINAVDEVTQWEVVRRSNALPKRGSSRGWRHDGVISRSRSSASIPITAASTSIRTWRLRRIQKKGLSPTQAPLALTPVCPPETGRPNCPPYAQLRRGIIYHGGVFSPRADFGAI